MFIFLKSRSRTVHHYNNEDQEKEYNNNEDQSAACVSFTVWRKSLLFSCKGFTVIGSDGSLVYRVDNYNDHPDRIILMDGAGNPIFTICRRKKLGIVDNIWLVYEGEVGKNSTNNSSSNKPIFRVRKNMMMSIMKTNPSVIAHVHGGVSRKGCVYAVQGSYEHRSCKILDESRRVVSEIKKKEALKGGVSFGLEVFDLIVKPGIDSRLAMAIVLLLDQMFS